MKTIRTAVMALSGLALLVAGASADDWPMWRHDTGRSGATSEALPGDLHLQWKRQLSQHTPAWPNESRLDFDVSREPVAAGGKLFLASADHAGVTAYDAATGEQLWRFHANGPVRFAPVVWQDKLYLGSDDGYLYCITAADGELLWKARGCPDDRPERYHLGNARLVSLWPVRGGPVVADGTVYFAAGIWPTLGVFIRAVDAETGETKWLDSESNRIDDVRIDHNELHEAALSPQGYLLVQGDMLIVPNGRSMPARYDRHTGERMYFVQGYRNGASRVISTDRYAFIGTNGVMNLSDGREVGNRWVDAGDDAPQKFDGAKFDLFEGPIHAYKHFPACDSRSVIGADGLVYGMSAGVFHAYDTSKATRETYEAKQGENQINPGKWVVPELWQLKSGQAGKNPSGLAMLKAGSRLYGHAQNVLLAAEIGGEAPEMVWEHELDGTPSTMLAADGRLFVVTNEGWLHCFGENASEAQELPLTPQPLAEPNDRWTETTREALASSGVTEGYCVLLGLGSGRMLDELLLQSSLHVIAIDPKESLVNSTRDRLIAADLYGTRADVLIGDPGTFSLPPYLASLILSENPRRAGIAPSAPADLLESLRPYGGALCFALGKGAQKPYERWAASSSVENLALESSPGMLIARREGALPGSAAWTHESADAARTYFSSDERVRSPLGVLWYGDGDGYGFYKYKDYGVGVKPQVIGGRMFALQLFSKTLHAVDVYTGRVLWTAKVEPFTRYACMDDGIYVAGKDQCVVYDPATGDVLRTLKYQVDAETPPFVSDIRVGDDVVVVAVAFDKSRSIAKGLWDSEALVALDRQSGEQLWTREADERFNNHALALGAGSVFCVDSAPGGDATQLARRGDLPETLPSTVLALDARTGDERWREVRDYPFKTYGAGNWLGLRANDDWVALAGEVGVLLAGKARELRAFDAASGDEMWHETIGGGQPMVIQGETFLTQAFHTYDLRTGQLSVEGPPFARGGCNYAVAGTDLIFVRDRCVSYIDKDTGDKFYLRNVRSGCSNSLVAADGLLNVPCFSVQCVCNYPIQTSFAMLHMPEVAEWDASGPRLAAQ